MKIILIGTAAYRAPGIVGWISSYTDSRTDHWSNAIVELIDLATTGSKMKKYNVSSKILPSPCRFRSVPFV